MKRKERKKIEQRLSAEGESFIIPDLSQAIRQKYLLSPDRERNETPKKRTVSKKILYPAIGVLSAAVVAGIVFSFAPLSRNTPSSLTYTPLTIDGKEKQIISSALTGSSMILSDEEISTVSSQDIYLKQNGSGSDSGPDDSGSSDVLPYLSELNPYMLSIETSLTSSYSFSYAKAQSDKEGYGYMLTYGQTMLSGKSDIAKIYCNDSYADQSGETYQVSGLIVRGSSQYSFEITRQADQSEYYLSAHIASMTDSALSLDLSEENGSDSAHGHGFSMTYQGKGGKTRKAEMYYGRKDSKPVMELQMKGSARSVTYVMELNGDTIYADSNLKNTDLSSFKITVEEQNGLYVYHYFSDSFSQYLSRQ